MAKSDRIETSKVRIWWAGHDTALLRIAVGLMAFAALVFLGYEFWRLLWQPTHIGPWHIHPGAIDLKIRHRAVHTWFAGTPEHHSGYAPASHVIFWPLHGWLEVRPATLIWAMSTVAALGWMVYLVVRESGANTRLESIFLALIPLSMYATGATIGNGQLIVHLLPMLVAGILLLHRGEPLWRRDMMAAALVLVSLSKPSISVPFFWILLFVPGRLRPALLVCLGYMALTLIAASFHEAGPLALFVEWLEQSLTWSGVLGHGHLAAWLFALGLGDYTLPAMFFVLLALGLWTYHYRHVDLWLLLGVSSLVARFWTYHRWYDDLLILLPIIALFRLSKRDASINGQLAGALLGITLLASIAPGGLYLFPEPWNTRYVNGQVIVWGVVLIFLLNRTRRDKNETAMTATSKALN